MDKEIKVKILCSSVDCMICGVSIDELRTDPVFSEEFEKRLVERALRSARRMAEEKVRCLPLDF